MTFRSVLVMVVCGSSLACSGDRERAPALNPNIDSGFADRSVIDAVEPDTASTDAIGADGDAPADVTESETDIGTLDGAPGDALPETGTDAPGE